MAATSSAAVVNVCAALGDSQAPVATIAAPAAFATDLVGTLTLGAGATVNVAVTSIEIQLDGVQIGTTGTTG